MYGGKMRGFIFVSFILLCNRFLTNATTSNVQCKEFEKDGVKVYGLELKTSSYSLSCYEDGEYSNCLSLFGEDRKYCQTECCPKAKKTRKAFAIECKEFEIEGHKVRGFTRKTPPIMNVPCFEENGLPNCEALFEPEKTLCMNICCNGSSVVSLEKERLLEEQPVEKNHSRNPGCSQGESEESLWWRRTSYVFEAVSGVLLITCIVLLAVLFNYQKCFKLKSRICQATDWDHENNRSAVMTQLV